MKTHVYGALALLALACGRPDNDLFGPVTPGTPDDGDGRNNGGTSGTDANATSGKAATSGGKNAEGGVDAEPSAGNSAVGGNTSEPQGGTAGGANPDMMGAAGAEMGDGGHDGMQPPEPRNPVCGNGVLETGEQCDDGGHTGQDGCNADCQVVCSQYGSGTLESDDHHCYRGFDEATFQIAQQQCEALGAHLATISDASENKLVQKLVNNSKFIGGWEDVPSNSKGQGNYTWLTKEPLSFTNWGRNQPSEQATFCGGQGWGNSCYQHCMAMMGDGTWANQLCDMQDGYVCEWEPAGKKP